MRNNIKLTYLLLFLNLSLTSQPLVFEKVFNFSSNDHLIDFIPTVDQGFIMIGSSSNNSFVMKLDLNGELLWKNTIGTGDDYYFNKIIQTQNSDFLIAGQHLGDAILLRLSNSGDSISSLHYPYTIDDNSFIGVIELENEDLIVAERREQNGGNYPPRIYLRGFTPNGSLKWYKDIGVDNYPVDFILSNNEILVTGVYDMWNVKIWISKYDTIGNWLTGKTMDNNQGNQIIESSSGDLYVAVDGYSSNGNYSVVKLDSDCELEWKLDNNNGYNCYSNTICQIKPAMFAFGGAIQDSLIITVFNDLGDSISSFIYDKYKSQNAKKMFCDETYLTIGADINTNPNNNRSILVIKLLLDSLIASNTSTYIIPEKTKPLIFPNPAEKFIDISDFQVNGETTTILIYSIKGTLQFIEHFEPGYNLEINVGSLNKGNYIAQIITNNKISYEKFIIK